MPNKPAPSGDAMPVPDNHVAVSAPVRQRIAADAVDQGRFVLGSRPLLRGPGGVNVGRVENGTDAEARDDCGDIGVFVLLAGQRIGASSYRGPGLAKRFHG